MPERQGVFADLHQAQAAYRDYLNLEHRGTEMLKLTLGTEQVTVTLPFYLFTLGREFERLGQPDDAVKLYLHLQMHYTFLDDENPLGLRAENRLRWILGDKHWFKPTPEVLIEGLRRALEHKDPQALEELMSRDFGFGEDAGAGERVPLDNRWAVQMMSSRWAASPNLTLTLVSRDSQRVFLKSVGWRGEHKIWNLVLHHRNRPQGWEWDTVTWGD
jgi:hypothetical protein